MRYIQHKDLLPSLRELYKRGGPYQKASETVHAVIGRISSSELDPFKGIALTKHGENRISKCRKYDLTKFCRLITVADAGFCYLLYAGTHDNCDAWINRHRGFVPAVDAEGRLIEASVSVADLDAESRVSGVSDQSYGKLYEKLTAEDFDFMVSALPRSVAREIENLESIHDEEMIKKVVEGIEDIDRRVMIYDVLTRLRQGNLKAARARLALFRGDIEHPDVETVVSNGEDLRIIPTDSPQYAKLFEHFVRTADYRDWMTFMHPEQEEVAESDFAGSAKLVGVSGSGKTCIVVKRAIVLAERYPSDDILVLTLNRPLAQLIDDLVSTSVSLPATRERIRVLPFFSLCQDLLNKFEPENWKLYDDRTWKSHEHIDEVWREYYRCELNNRDAECLHPVHDSLISRNINAERYIREEFDWIRSAVPFHDRQKYLSMSRGGRSYPLEKRFRQLLLDGLNGWEEKMRVVGVTDYLGIATALYRYMDELSPLYRCILVDECQDFGTIELEVVKRLVIGGADDLFLCGDAAQQVSWKHQSLTDAGISVPGARSRKIERNYRNSRDVLQAAHEILLANLTVEMLEQQEFEILDPEYANFSGPVPLELEAQGLEEEIAYAVAYAKSEIGEKENYKACVAICGFTLYEIQKFGEEIGVAVLDGTRNISDGSLFLADLEQTKGFEFDLVCVVNARDGTIPNPATPKKEQFRDLSKLYVAMTRAKLQLVLSYSHMPSIYIGKAEERILSGKWSEYLAVEEVIHLGEPKELDHHKNSDEVRTVGSMTGEEFLYTDDALGVSPRLIGKLREVVGGRKRFLNRVPIEWGSISEAARDVRTYPGSRQQFGPEVVKEFESLLEKLKVGEKRQ